MIGCAVGDNGDISGLSFLRRPMRLGKTKAWQSLTIYCIVYKMFHAYSVDHIYFTQFYCARVAQTQSWHLKIRAVQGFNELSVESCPQSYCGWITNPAKMGCRKTWQNYPP